MSDGTAKLKFFGFLKTAEALGDKLEYEAISDSLEVPVRKLKKWETEYNKLDEEETVVDLLDVDQMVIDEVTKHVAEEVSEEIVGPQMDIVDGKIVVVKDTAVQDALDAKLESFKGGVKGLQLLQEEVQGTAGTLVSRIAVLAEDSELTAKDLASLTAALTSMQQAFFNKPTTNIQVNTLNSEGGSLLSSFREQLKS